MHVDADLHRFALIFQRVSFGYNIAFQDLRII